jgi:acetyltransferase
MMEQTRIYRALQGVRGRKPVDLPGLERLLVWFSRMVMEQQWIQEIDINPLLASAEQLIALDARIILYGKDVPVAALTKPAIRPYPSQYSRRLTLQDGLAIRIRPIRPEDEPMMVAFHNTLSDRSVYLRYFGFKKLDVRTAHDRLARMCFIDYDRQMAVVAELAAGSPEHILGVGRLIKVPNAGEAEVAFIVSDAFQGRGLGGEMLRLLIDFARGEGLTGLTASFLSENDPMRKLLLQFGFELEPAPSYEANPVAGRLKL